MNTHTYAVIVSPNGGIPSVFSKNDPDYYVMTVHLNYEELHSGSKKECNSYWEEMVSQLNEIEYFA